MDTRCVRSLSGYMWSFLVLSGLLQLVNFFRSTSGSDPDWQFAFQTLGRQFPFSFYGLQLIAGFVVPFVLLLLVLVAKMKDGFRNALAVISSALVLVHLFAFLWNLIIGGQLASRSLRGAISFEPEFLGKEGILISAIILVCPIIFLVVLTKILPPFEKKVKAAG